VCCAVTRGHKVTTESAGDDGSRSLSGASTVSCDNDELFDALTAPGAELVHAFDGDAHSAEVRGE